MSVTFIPLCNYGKLGSAYRETEPGYSLASIIDDIGTGQIECTQILAVDPDEHTCYDVSEDTARELRKFGERLCSTAIAFVRAQLGDDAFPDEPSDPNPYDEHRLTAHELGIGNYR